MDNNKEKTNIFTNIIDEDNNNILFPNIHNRSFIMKITKLYTIYNKNINKDINLDVILKTFEIYSLTLDALDSDPVINGVCSYLGNKYNSSVKCKLSGVNDKLDNLMKVFMSGTIATLELAKESNLEKDIYNIDHISIFKIFINKLFFFFGLKCLVPPEKYFKEFIADINSIFDKELIVVKCSDDDYGCGRALETVGCETESDTGRIIVYKSDPDNEFINSEGLFKVAMNVQKGCGKKRKARKTRKARKSKSQKKTYK